MIDFSKATGISDDYGVITKITDASGRVLWALSGGEGGGKVILEVEKITSNTYAGETTYTGEQFILLNIYPKTNGTVSVTYGGLTKTITDTSGAAEPNAQQVFFGTFNGVSDSVETPASGVVTITGDWRGVGRSKFESAKMDMNSYYGGITAVGDLSGAEIIPNYAFGGDILNRPCTKITSVTIPDGVTTIGNYAFAGCTGLTSINIPDGVTTIGNYAFARVKLKNVTIPDSVTTIGYNPWSQCFNNNAITVASGNKAYKIDSNCLIEIATNTLISGFGDSFIPSFITTIGNEAFRDTAITSATIPDGVKSIGLNAFYNCRALTRVEFANTSGWYVTTTKGGDASTGTAVDVSDPVNNVTLLCETYATNYYWYRA
jgi:hypothetical protein